MLIDCMRFLFVESDNVLAFYSSCYVCILDNDYRFHDNLSLRLRKTCTKCFKQEYIYINTQRRKKKNQYESLLFLDKNFKITSHDDKIRLYVIIKMRNKFCFKKFLLLFLINGA